MINTPIQVRQAVPADAGEIVAMQRDLAVYCGYDMSTFHITQEVVKATIESEEQAGYFVAQVDTDLAGMMLCHRVPLSWKGISGIHIEDLYVRPAYRHGLGVGKLLVAKACTNAVAYAGERPDLAFVRLDTASHDNDDTQRFYTGIGMTSHDMNFRLYGQALQSLVV